MLSTGKRIRERREALGLGVAEFATAVGVKRMTVWRVETGKTPIPLRKAPQWAAALKWPPRRLITMLVAEVEA